MNKKYICVCVCIYSNSKIHIHAHVHGPWDKLLRHVGSGMTRHWNVLTCQVEIFFFFWFPRRFAIWAQNCQKPWKQTNMSETSDRVNRSTATGFLKPVCTHLFDSTSAYLNTNRYEPCLFKQTTTTNAPSVRLTASLQKKSDFL